MAGRSRSDAAVEVQARAWHCSQGKSLPACLAWEKRSGKVGRGDTTAPGRRRASAPGRAASRCDKWPASSRNHGTHGTSTPRNRGGCDDASYTPGTSAKDVWAVGDGGTILRWNGTARTHIASDEEANLTAVWANRSDDVWAVGAGGVVLRWNGRTWNAVSSGTSMDLLAVWGTGSGDVWIAGILGTLLRARGLAPAAPTR